MTLPEQLARTEREMIATALNGCHGHRKRTAALLGITERSLYYRLAHYREAGHLHPGSGHGGAAFVAGNAPDTMLSGRQEPVAVTRPRFSRSDLGGRG